MDRRITPNFFIVGAPKCGTRSLYEYIKPHPNIFMSEVKEPHFLCPDLEMSDSWRVHDEEQYYNLYSGATGQRWIGESSVCYLRSSQAPHKIQAICSDPRIVIMLRQPVDFMYSQHGQFLWSGNEDIVDFQEALDAQEVRRQGKRLPPAGHFHKGLQYDWMACFHEQVQLYYETFGRERVHIILFEDFTQNTAKAYEDLMGFLGLDDPYRPQFAHHNDSRKKQLRNLRLRRFIKQNALVRKSLLALPESVRGRMGDALSKTTGSQVQRQTKLDDQTRAKLTAGKKDEIDKLAKLIGRDLAHWHETPSKKPHAASAAGETHT